MKIIIIPHHDITPDELWVKLRRWRRELYVESNTWISKDWKYCYGGKEYENKRNHC